MDKQNQMNPMKVFEAIAKILTARGEGKVTVKNVQLIETQKQKAG